MTPQVKSIIGYAVIAVAVLAASYLKMIPDTTTQLVLVGLVTHYMGLQAIPPTLAGQIAIIPKEQPKPTIVVPGTSPVFGSTPGATIVDTKPTIVVPGTSPVFGSTPGATIVDTRKSGV